MASSIVVGFDGSPCALAALDKAAELARLDGSQVVIVFAFEIPAAYGGETGDYRRAVREIAEKSAAQAAERVAKAGVDYEVDLAPERPVEGLVHASERHDASMIVVGTHGEHPLAGAILGSVPHKLLHVSPVPVLVVPAARD
ncbi:MAG TPA: universal stress protein [Gaiellaceae bacterium]|jgi:nucleotide-binding universal stress UspA family protein|nr:universal stress protein [Gaiellaceae bacterium]